MSDTSKRVLIEEAAKAMYFEDCGVAALEDDAEPFREMARVAFAVFEQAPTPTDKSLDITLNNLLIEDVKPMYTPTDDERRGLTDRATEAFASHEGAPTWQDDPKGRDAALRWHMRGFEDGLNARRTVQGEPGKRAEWEAEQGETEWEYARMNRLGNVCEPDDDLADAQRRAEASKWAGGYNRVVRRHRASEWMPVPDTTGAES